jgi:hypothetical protein
VIASTSAMLVESISGRDRTSSRDAGRTSINRLDEARWLRTMVFLSVGPAGKYVEDNDSPAFQEQGRKDIADLRQKDQGWYCLARNQQFRFLFAYWILLPVGHLVKPENSLMAAAGNPGSLAWSNDRLGGHVIGVVVSWHFSQFFHQCQTLVGVLLRHGIYVQL